MLYTRAAIEQRGSGSGFLLPSIAEGEVRVARSVDREPRYPAELELDQVLADSFPASDPPSWTLGSDHHETPAEKKDPGGERDKD